MPGKACREAENAANAWLAVHGDLAAHLLDQALADHQAQARPAKATRRGTVGLAEGIEQARHLLRAHADAGVLDLHLQLKPLRRVRLHLHVNGHRTGFGELDGVAGEVDQHLFQAQGVAHQVMRHLGAAHHGKPQTLGARQLSDDRVHVGNHLVEGELAHLEQQPPRLDLGEVENVVDDAHQVARSPLGLGDKLSLPLVQRGLQAQMRKPDDGVQRGADLMAHVGQEGALGLRCRFGLLLGQGQLCGAAEHPFLQRLLLGQDFPLIVPPLGDIPLHGDEARGHAVRAAHGRDLHSHPIRLTGFRVVQQLLVHRLRAVQGHADAPHRLGVRLWALQQVTGLLPDHVFQGVAGLVGEGPVDPLGAARGIGDDDEVVGRARHDGQLLDVVLDELLPGDVANHPRQTATLDRGHGDLHPGQAGVCPPHAEAGPRVRLRLGRPRLAQGCQPLPVLRHDELGQGLAQARGDFETQGLLPGLVQEDELAVGIGLEHHFREQIDAPPHALLGQHERLGEAVRGLDMQVLGEFRTAVVVHDRHPPAFRFRQGRPEVPAAPGCWSGRGRTAGRWTRSRTRAPRPCAPTCNPTGWSRSGRARRPHDPWSRCTGT